MRFAFVLLGCLFVLALAGCPGETMTGTDAGPVSFPDCEAIIDACHYVDPGAGPIHDCHETAHDATSNDACAPISAGCVAMCEAIDGGLAHAEDAGHSHDVDGGHSHDVDAGAPDVDGGHAEDVGPPHDEDAGAADVDGGA